LLLGRGDKGDTGVGIKGDPGEQGVRGDPGLTGQHETLYKEYNMDHYFSYYIFKVASSSNYDSENGDDLSAPPRWRRV
jgi:hypothetical protein